MKRQCLNHPKTRRLMRTLNIPLYQAIGILEIIWLMAAEHYDDGALRGLNDDDIAAAVDWDGDAAELVFALIDAGWLDKSDSGEYLIHDWHDHCPDFVHMRLARAGRKFATGADPRSGRLSKWERTRQDVPEDSAHICAHERTEHDSVRTCAHKTARRAHMSAHMRTTQPNPTKPNHTSGVSVTPNTPLPPTDSPPPLKPETRDETRPSAPAEARQAPEDDSPPLKLPTETALTAQMGRGSGKPLNLDAKLPPDQAITLVRLMLLDWMERQAARLPPPDDELCRRLLVAHGMSLDRVRDWLLWLRRRGKRPESVQSWGWFAHLAEAEASAASAGPALAAGGSA